VPEENHLTSGLAADAHQSEPNMFLLWHAEAEQVDPHARDGGPGTRRVGRSSLPGPPADKPLVLLLCTEDVARELRAEAAPAPFYYFGSSGADPLTGIDRDLRQAVRLAAHPVDLLRRLGEWADRAQATCPAGRVAACWHPAVTAEVLRQASRYPVHVVCARTAGEAVDAVAPLAAELPAQGVA
jgi:hypothetical protein